MADLSDTPKTKFWPTAEKFFEAVLDLRENLRDFDLSRGTIEVGPLGVPKNITGINATVFKVHWNGQDWALRCFLRGAMDLQQRYGKIKQFFQQHSVPYIVNFDYQPDGIRIFDQWYPILKMDWVDGQTLDHYIRVSIARGGLNLQLAETFRKLCADMQGFGIAHGDLQHGNIIVRDERVCLVDDDGLYVPSLQGMRSNETGSRHYQHPRRTMAHFGPYLDNFSAWVIYTSLKALSNDPQLFHRLVAGEDSLLFRQEDFNMPLMSPAFAALEHCESKEIQNLAEFIRCLLDVSPEQVPPLSSRPEVPDSLPPLNPAAPQKRVAARSALSQSLPAYGNNAYAPRDPRGAAATQTKLTALSAPQHPPGKGGIFAALSDAAAQQNAIASSSNQPSTASMPAYVPPPPTPQPDLESTGTRALKTDFDSLGVPGIETELQELPPRKVASVTGTLNPIVMVQTLKHKSIVQNGLATRGRVIEKLAPTRGLTGHKIKYRFDYDHKGECCEMETTMDVNAKQFEEVQFGEEVTIVYMPGGAPSVIYKLSAYRAV